MDATFILYAIGIAAAGVSILAGLVAFFMSGSRLMAFGNWGLASVCTSCRSSSAQLTKQFRSLSLLFLSHPSSSPSSRESLCTSSTNTVTLLVSTHTGASNTSFSPGYRRLVCSSLLWLGSSNSALAASRGKGNIPKKGHTLGDPSCQKAGSEFYVAVD